MPLMVVVWTGVSYAIEQPGVPAWIPRRLRIPNTWDVRDSWRVRGGGGVGLHSWLEKGHEAHGRSWRSCVPKQHNVRKAGL